MMFIVDITADETPWEGECRKMLGLKIQVGFGYLVVSRQRQFEACTGPEL